MSQRSLSKARCFEKQTLDCDATFCAKIAKKNIKSKKRTKPLVFLTGSKENVLILSQCMQGENQIPAQIEAMTTANSHTQMP